VRCYNVRIPRRKAGFFTFPHKDFEEFAMAKSSPEKLAQALRANLKRRKQAKTVAAPETDPKSASKPSKSPSKTPLKIED
jgi:hypothetical protein